MNHPDINEAARTGFTTLDDIHAGGAVLIAVAMERLEQVRDALLGGRFNEADERAREMLAKIAPLAEAERLIGVLKGAKIMRLADIQPDMHVVGRGVVIEREDGLGSCHSGDHPNHPWVKLTFEDTTHLTLLPEVELAVLPDAGP